MADPIAGVRVRVVEARGLLAADKGGTSDPYAVVTLHEFHATGAEPLDFSDVEITRELCRSLPRLGTEAPKTKVWPKTLNPHWNETFELGSGIAKLPVLSDAFLCVQVFDKDNRSSESLGKVMLPLKQLAVKKRCSVNAWFSLEPDRKLHKQQQKAAGPRAEGALLGEVHLDISLLGSREEIYDVFSKQAKAMKHYAYTGARLDKDLVRDDEEHARLFEHEHANQLRVQVLSGSDLKAMDSSMFGKGSSDPFVTLSVHGQKAKSKVQKKTLAPQWNETFDLNVDDTSAVLHVQVYDYDLIGSNDFMGEACIPLRSFVDKRRREVTCVLQDEGGGIAAYDEANSRSTPAGDRGLLHLRLWWRFDQEVKDRTYMELCTSDDEVEEVAEAEQEQEGQRMDKSNPGEPKVWMSCKLRRWDA